jgi:hypothetical protein
LRRHSELGSESQYLPFPLLLFVLRRHPDPELVEGEGPLYLLLHSVGAHGFSPWGMPFFFGYDLIERIKSFYA